MNRSTFLRASGLLAAAPFILPRSEFAPLSFFGDPDAEICAAKFKLAIEKKWAALPIGDLIVEVGKSFIGNEYVAHTLEQQGEEQLVINLRGFDCVSFYENCLVFARCIKKGTTTFDDYKKELQFVRYRGGIIDGYPSRLHYTSDYFFDNEKKNVLTVVTKNLGGEPYVKPVNFMSTHTDSYKQLKENPAFVPIIKALEAEMNARPGFYIPKEHVASAAAGIRNGDIIGITTSIEGMDVGHTGVAIWQGEALHFMHAPITGAKVQITDVPLADYLKKIKKHTGIMVARAREVNGGTK